MSFAGERGRLVVGSLALAIATALAPATVAGRTPVGTEAPAAKGALEGSGAPGAAAGPGVILDVTLDPAARRLGGHARLLVANTTGASLREIPLWLYPNHLATRAPALGDVSYHWLYPGRFSPAGLDLGAVRVDGKPAGVGLEDTPAGVHTIARVTLPQPLLPGGEVAIELDFETRVPRRFGGFGCDGPRCRFMGGFYPMPAAQTSGGFDLEAAPARAGSVRLTLRTPQQMALVVDGQPSVWPGPGVGTTVESADLPYATIVTDRVLRPETLAVGAHLVRYLHRAPRPPDSEDRLLPYVREDVAGLVLAAVRQALELADATVCGAACRAAAAKASSGTSDPALTLPLTLVEAPLRHQMVQVHGNVILVSDQIFGIFPAQRLRKYHQLELARAVLTAVVDARLAAREAPADRDLAAGVLGTYLAELFAARAFQRVEYARDILRPYDFVPAIDQLIYAPLLASASTYFGDVDDEDLVRDDPRTFADPRRPGARLIYNKLLDLVGPGRFPQLATEVLDQGRPFRRAAADAFGAELDWFWQEWLGPRPRVNYRLESVRVTPGPAGSHVTIDARREGDLLREPVEVTVEDRSGAKQTLVWDDRLAAHRFELDLPAGLKAVELDPRGRLVETALGSLRPSDDPRADDRLPRRWRLLYEGFGALLNVSSLTANFEAAFLLKPQHDLRHAFLLTAFHSESIDLGAGGAYFWNFGPQADKNSLQSSLLGGLNVSRINPSFGLGPTDRALPGFAFSGRLSLLHDSRDFLYDPWHAVGARLGVGYTLTALDDGERLSQVGVAAEALRLLELSPGHVLALDGSAAATFGDIRLPGQLTGAGGPAALRGFLADELLARAHVIASLQFRDDYVSGLAWNLLHFTTVRGLGGTVFADAAAITSCDGYAFSRQQVYYDVGYSFRVLHDAFGVYQQLLSIDLAVPINRHDEPGSCLGRPVPAFGRELLTREPVRLPFPSRPPFVVQISFVPSF